MQPTLLQVSKLLGLQHNFEAWTLVKEEESFQKQK